MESTILDIYSRCLKKLDRVEDYVHITLKTLAKGLVTGSYTSGPRFNLGVLDVRGYLKDIIIASKSLTEPVIVPLKSYFSNVHVSSFLEHFDDRDGFKLALSIRSRMPDVLEVHSVKIRLDSIQDGQAREIWCSTDDTARIDRNETTFYVASKVLLPMPFSI